MSPSPIDAARTLAAWPAGAVGLPLRALGRWAVSSQVGARRNALAANTALARRRRERDEVEQFLRQVDDPQEIRSLRSS